jgi:hypothetical protein
MDKGKCRSNVSLSVANLNPNHRNSSWLGLMAAICLQSASSLVDAKVGEFEEAGAPIWKRVSMRTTKTTKAISSCMSRSSCCMKRWMIRRFLPMTWKRREDKLQMCTCFVEGTHKARVSLVYCNQGPSRCTSLQHDNVIVYY